MLDYFLCIFSGLDIRLSFIQCLRELLHGLCCQPVLVVGLLHVNEDDSPSLFNLHLLTSHPRARNNTSAVRLVAPPIPRTAEMASQRCVVKKVGKCVVVRLVSENRENRINPEFLVEFNRALDQAERWLEIFAQEKY